LVLHFSDFAVIFYAIYKNQENTFTIGVHLLQQGPWEDFEFRNVVHGRGGRCGLGKFRRCAAGFRPGRVGEGSRGSKGPVCGLKRVVEHRWAAGRRRPDGLAAERP
jgi:hypothetical protein